MHEPFTWASYLGAGTALFLLIGVFHMLIGAGAVLLGVPPTIVMLSPRTDHARFARDSKELLGDEVVRELRVHHVIVLGGLIPGLGILEAGVAWYGVRTGQPWAVVVLAVAILAMVPFWLMMTRQLTKKGVPVSWAGDVQPFVVVPTFLVVPATVLSVIGLA